MPLNFRRIIGLTGGIATGKSTVSRYLADIHNLPVLDADIYAKEAVQIGSPILQDILQKYGEKVTLADGNLHRQALGEIIFNHTEEKHWLESKIHPYVRQRFESLLEKLEDDTVVLVIPLLFEAKMTDLVTEIWVVSCDYQQQLQRLIQRNNLTFAQAEARIRSQFPLAKKVQNADIVLDNSTSLEALFKQIDIAINKLE